MSNSTAVQTAGSRRPAVVAVDVRSLAEQFRTGVGAYVYQVLVRLPALTPELRYRYFSHAGHPVHLPELRRPGVEFRAVRCPSKLWNTAVRLVQRPRLDRVCQAGAVFLPSLQSVALSPRAKLAVTVHDLSFERYPEFFSPVARLWHAAVNPRWLCRRADAIFAVSAHTKAEVVRYYGVPPERVTVTPLGVDPSFHAPASALERDDVRRRYRLPPHYLLAVGNLEPRKNFSTLIAAYDRLQPDASLVVVGRPMWGSQRLKQQARQTRRPERIRFLGYVPERDRPALYQLATGFVYPSYYEGFGLPVLEALAAGTPVVASAATSLPEVVGDAGILVDPYDAGEVAAAIDAVLRDEPLRERLVQRGRLRARQFSWDLTAKATAAALEVLA